MTLQEVGGSLRSGQVGLWPVGGDLHFGPAHRVPGTLRTDLAEHKAAVEYSGWPEFGFLSTQGAPFHGQMGACGTNYRRI